MVFSTLQTGTVKHRSIVSQMEEMYQLFHSILMGDEPDELDRFVDKYQDTKGITGFIEGLKRDITPVKNAISLPFSSGFC